MVVYWDSIRIGNSLLKRIHPKCVPTLHYLVKLSESSISFKLFTFAQALLYESRSGFVKTHSIFHLINL